MIVSLFVDHCLFFHPDQQDFIDDKLAACTVGSLIRQIRAECFLEFVEYLISAEDRHQILDDLVKYLRNGKYELMHSTKHMPGRTLGRLEPTPSLKQKNAA